MFRFLILSQTISKFYYIMTRMQSFIILKHKSSLPVSLILNHPPPPLSLTPPFPPFSLVTTSQILEILRFWRKYSCLLFTTFDYNQPWNQIFNYLIQFTMSTIHHTCSTGSNWIYYEFLNYSEFERRFKFKPRLKYGWFHLKLYQMFQDL